jgi:hypothetical protein
VPLSEQEKVRVRDHLAYLNVAELSTYVLGLPAGLETQLLIEKAMSSGFILESALAMVRQILCELDGLDGQRAAVRASISVEKIGAIGMRDPTDAFAALDQEFVRLVGRLANAFGVSRNPFDHRRETFGIPVS